MSSCSRCKVAIFFCVSFTLSGSAASASALSRASFGIAWRVSFKASSSVMLCVILKARLISSSVVGTFFPRERSSQLWRSLWYRVFVIPVARIPLYISASRSSCIESVSMPSAWIISSSALIARIRLSSWNLRKESEPKVGMSSSRHRFTSCSRPTLSRVISSLKSLLKPTICSFVTRASPIWTFSMNLMNSEACPLESLVFFLI
mmetsp:Transcript_31271/g.64816  ORF Transcript_31271/g.64816 Transcript_31271/m.64816 type:complete len:205 (-) Transcript_31271:882-1496(-)